MEIKYKNLRVLGPAVLRVKIPDEIIEKLNEYIDNKIKNKSKVEKLNYDFLQPRGSTPLLDAIGLAINELDNHRIFPSFAGIFQAAV